MFGLGKSGDKDTAGKSHQSLATASDRAHDRPDDPGPDSKDSALDHAPSHEHDAADKPDSPTDLTKPSWLYTVRSTVREFSEDECTDLAAALTYYSILALFPAAIALLSLVGVVGQGEKTVETLLTMLRDLGAGGAADTLEPTLVQLSQSTGAGWGLLIGLAAALWSASGYVNAFSRGMNRIYEIDEGRPIWKLRPMMLLITAVTILLTALVALGLIVTGPAAEVVGDTIGLGSTAVTVWNIAKWPVLLLVVILIVALLYYSTPNVKQPKFRWLSVGATVAIVVWVLASAGFGLYVANFSNYNRTYGSLAGVIVFLLWLWITNLALLFGAELDAELERARELQAGMPAEETIQLPPRDTTKSEKAAKKRQKDVARARALRRSRGERQESRAPSA
ncbi:YihY/virulence factor BrkB family protein [Nocardioides jishulii]|uniref:YihY/virulence factor BrkB family protein n=1 Tax=Nocardioides jishulii TaxID=2575440 RepID=A0A4U2YN41_9ACTN|nr:YihY/virulence factor BrkB family protein [Nocardioides jishulii]QCX27910.1 YihY/virulence factor BrkB family protein [Nocardioides jishulii]TKI62716.1 YihY/virulence factor BrkB family protein [Nocardioides jishulii]